MSEAVDATLDDDYPRNAEALPISPTPNSVYWTSTQVEPDQVSDER